MRATTTILKIGGNVINQPEQLAQALHYLATLPSAAVLVHGGGRKADELLLKMGQEPSMIDGRRITDAATLEVVTMVYAGLLNKQIVAQLQALQVAAIGLSGADANLILAQQRPVRNIDYGFAGDVGAVNATFLEQLLTQGFYPVICPITHNGAGQLLNTNADTIAQAVAQALATLRPISLQYCFELAGVLEDLQRPDSVIARISAADYAELRAKNIISAGMIPKLDNAFAALAAGVAEVQIGNLSSLQAGKATCIVGE